MKIGMVGGIGPESTVDYYQRLTKLFKENVSSSDYPEIIINSINMTAMLKLIADGDLERLVILLTDAVQSLERAGAGLAFIASNTPHIVFNEVKRNSPIPLFSIVEAARIEAEKRGIEKAALLGTLFTMQGSYYQTEFEKSGIKVVVPNFEEQQFIQHKLFTEIELGIFLEETRNGLLQITDRLVKEEGADGVILGCTELPLILTRDDYGVPFLNTTSIHVKHVMDRYIEMERAK
jgi:aspartate racemase